MLCAPFERLNSPDPLDDAVPTGACQVHHNFELAEQIISTATLQLPQPSTYFACGKYPEVIATLKAAKPEKAQAMSELFLKRQKQQEAVAETRRKEIVRCLYTLK